MTINQAIMNASKLIEYIDARVLMEYVLKEDRQYIVSHGDNEITENLDTYMNLVKKIQEGYPLQYITHNQNFMGINFYVNENVLIPQPDTEILAIKALEIIKQNIHENYRILDLCTGSGAIAVSIAHKLKTNNDAKIYASDISKKALDVAKKNDKDNEIKYIQSDMFEKIQGEFDMIVSNPPYIREDVIHTLSKDVQNEPHIALSEDVIHTLSKDVQNEPHIALSGGQDGLKFYKIIRDNIDKYLKKGGYLIMEIGYDQKQELLQLFEGAECVQDLSGNDRVIIWKR